jgi:hypothetical protein
MSLSLTQKKVKTNLHLVHIDYFLLRSSYFQVITQPIHPTTHLEIENDSRYDPQRGVRANP